MRWNVDEHAGTADRPADAPAISVIIPTYNCAPFIKAAIDSIFGQTIAPAEVIVIDDGSTDGTEQVLAAYGSRISYHRQANAGVSVARNRGLEIATGDFITFLDADDLAAPTRLELQWRKLTSVPDAVACFSGYWIAAENGDLLRNVRCETSWPDQVHRGELTFLQAVHALTYDIPLPMTVMFRNVIGQYARFPTGVKIGEDVLFCAMLRTLGAFTYVASQLYGYRSRNGSASRTHNQVDSFQQRLAWLLENRERYCPQYSEQEVIDSTWKALADVARTCYWARRREHFLPLRNHLRSGWPAHLPSPDVARWRWMPDWLWNAKEHLDNYRQKRSSTALKAATAKAS